jgi:hypothetical protein
VSYTFRNFTGKIFWWYQVFFLEIVNCEFIIQHLLLVYQLLHNGVAFPSWFNKVLNFDSIHHLSAMSLTLIKEFVHAESLCSSKQSKTSLCWTAARYVRMVRLGNILLAALHTTTYRIKQFALQWIKLWSVAVRFWFYQQISYLQFQLKQLENLELGIV